MNKPLHFVFAVDAAYEAPLRVLWTSLFAHHRDRALEFHVLHDGVRPERQRALQDFAGRHGVHTHWHCVEQAWTRGLPVNTTFPSSTQYHRLFVAEVLPEAVDRVLYLDVDTLVCRDLSPLFETDLTGAVVGAVEDLDARSSITRLGLPDGASYFNSGVLLMDRRAWARFKVAERVRAYLADNVDKPERWRYPDQDALNVVLAGQWCALPLQWNIFASYRLHRPVDLSEERRAALRCPGIIHFTGPEKPWLGHCAPPYHGWYSVRRREAGVRLISPWTWHNTARRWQQERELRRMRALHRKEGLGDDF